MTFASVAMGVEVLSASSPLVSRITAYSVFCMNQLQLCAVRRLSYHSEKSEGGTGRTTLILSPPSER